MRTFDDWYFSGWPVQCAHLWTHVININTMNFKNHSNKYVHPKSGAKCKNVTNPTWCMDKSSINDSVVFAENISWRYYCLLPLLLLMVLRFSCKRRLGSISQIGTKKTGNIYLSSATCSYICVLCKQWSLQCHENHILTSPVMESIAWRCGKPQQITYGLSLASFSLSAFLFITHTTRWHYMV